MNGMEWGGVEWRVCVYKAAVDGVYGRRGNARPQVENHAVGADVEEGGRDALNEEVGDGEQVVSVGVLGGDDEVGRRHEHARDDHDQVGVVLRPLVEYEATERYEEQLAERSHHQRQRYLTVVEAEQQAQILERRSDDLVVHAVCDPAQYEQQRLGHTVAGRVARLGSCCCCCCC